MSEPFLAEIRIFGFNFPPRGWASCAGQLLAISQNTAVFSLLGTSYGGDGRVTFGLPNLQGIVPISQGQGPGLTDRVVGEQGGTETVTLTLNEMAAHSHAAQCNTAVGDDYGPTNDVWAPDAAAANEYAPGSSGAMSPLALSVTGGNQPHNNMQPFVAMNYCIALEGIFPARS